MNFKRIGETFLVFLRLGCFSFGGPVAHLGYFQEAFVTRRRWITQERFADLVALSHFLPGPSSSQVGYAIGVEQPVAIHVQTTGASVDQQRQIRRELAERDFSPKGIIERLTLRTPIFERTAREGHVGRANLPWEKAQRSEPIITSHTTCRPPKRVRS